MSEAELVALRVELQALTDESVKQRREITTLTAKLAEARRCYDLRRERSDNAESALQDAREALRELLRFVPERGATLHAGYGNAASTARAVLVEGARDKTQGITYEGLKALHAETLGDAGASGGEGS